MRHLAQVHARNGRSECGHMPGKMPYWPDGFRAIPNALLRSSLFAALGRGGRRYVERLEIAAWGNVIVRYTGAQLDQSDLSVWMAVLHVVRHQPIERDAVCRVTAYQLLRLLGRTDSGKNRETLQRQLSRLSATSIDLDAGEYGYEGSLIDEVHRDNATREYRVQLNPSISRLFQQDQYSRLDWAIRNQLNGQPLAQWLHAFYSTHAQPYPLKIETLHELCGSEARCLRDFTKGLRRALDAVDQASQMHNGSFLWEIRDGKVRVSRKGSPSQMRYLASRGKIPF